MTPRLAGWRLAGLGGALGVLAGFGQAPYDQPLILMAALVGAVYVYRGAETGRQAALFGWALGTGYFAHALQWIVSPFLVDVARHGWMAPFAVAFLSAGLALFWGAAFWAARRLDAHRAWPLILCLSSAELVRAYVFTGFPWAMPSQALVDKLGGQALAWTGPYALNAVMIAIAVALGFAARTGPQRVMQYGVILFGLGAFVLPPMVPEAAMTDHTVRLVQPNAAQRDKWDPDKIPVFFDRQLQFTTAPPEDGSKVPDLVLWSETAIPWQLDYAGTALVEIAKAGANATVALGLQRSAAERFYNSMVVLDQDGTVAQVYDKHHLVPFGEYVPFADTLNKLGIFGLAQRIPAGYSSGVGAKLLNFGPLGRALPLICYEAVFPHDVNAAPKRPDFLIQITNDAWFGKGAGPRQHLAQARMRAIEKGLPLARSANTGISAMIDPYGRILASLPLNTAGFVDAALPRPLPPTVYSRTGDMAFAVLLLLGFGFAVIRIRRHSAGFND
ncbi:apolipoprotein N-acyltransferase [Sulfitobacter sp. JBTF-M27]|uniref:Apolipoprotein N-acyltransferase n=1 Tax=Sulfitobacter sediminilitoris TaxID=2698830 RepID=A0A6P0CB46_9RHOB|nr:apolipoprotein N-acyltransferase [Sulfitobacter sediminilitoris]NEK22368.1 apolipoprotein N-acyltransferase [Sulfitobacter sediminilitoris]